jgi:hypothetical protein
VKWGVARGWGAGMTENRSWVDRNGLATTHLDSALISASASKLRAVRNTKTRYVTLQQGGYLCPKCEEFSLSFEATGMGD